MEIEIKLDPPSLKKEQIGVDISSGVASKVGVKIGADSLIASKDGVAIPTDSVVTPK